MKMTTYPGMHLGGEVRESISLDEDDLSDVEDEVFIRDGKNGYKLAEELNVKRPLMAPRRKPKPDLTTRLRSRPPCRAFCKPCCYVLAALSTLIGLITLVVILVSIFPLPLDRLRDWIINKSKPEQASNTPKLLPCNNFKVIDVWSSSLPFLTSESPVRLLDINNDGSQDIIFGFGTGENHEILKDETFCQVFLKMSSPCDGGIIALNGVNGEILWKHWLNDTIFDLHCTADINKDNFDDCLAVGKHGTIIVINSKNGSTIWQLNTGRNNVFVGNFISDQNNDNISDIVMSHSALKGGNGHILLLSGLTGEEIKRIPTPGGAKTFYMPQLIKQTENNSYILYGTGTPMKSGNLSIVPMEVLKSEYLMNNTITIYKDPSNGMMTQSVLVDITGDHIPDIITAMYNSSVVAINGKTLKQIWNFTIENGETKIVPTPGYFNSDNVTDFLVIYQKRDNILNYNYTQTYIIDGKLGKSIYQPTGKSVISQMNGILLSAEGFGFDSYVFWTVECKENEKLKSETENIDCLKRLNESSIFRLNALNQYHEPPGFQIYSSEDKSNEFSNAKSALKLLREYYDNFPKNNYNPGQTEVNDNYNVDPRPIDIKKYGASSFRHKDNRNGLLNNPELTYDQEDYSQEEFVPEFNVFDDLFNQNQKYSLLNGQEPPGNNRDPRSKEKKINTASTIKDGKSKKKNLSDKKYGIYGYQNIKNARSRLLHDVNDLPKDILRDTYFKNEEMKLKKSKFEQRDINSHKDKIKENEEIRKIIENEKKATQNMSLNLWDLESEKETLERESGYWRGKRDLNDLPNKIRKISSVGAVLNPINMTNDTILNEIDVVFIVYWQPNFTQKELLHYDIQECVDERMEKQSAMDESQKLTVEQETNNCKEEQTSLKRISNFFDVLHKLKLGQMTVYRITVKCECEKVDNKKERCARFLPYEYQSWPQYLGKLGDGTFLERKHRN